MPDESKAGLTGVDRRDTFIKTKTRLVAVPAVPTIQLFTADEATELWEQTEAEMGRIGLPPPFWAFPWAGGQALAAYLTQHPEVVRGRSVLDVASGSGLVAIAAARAGAFRVWANDIDLFAQAAARLNAVANGVGVELLPGDRVGTDDGWDVVLAGDVSYERDMATHLLDWLEALHRRGALVLLGDPGRSYLPRDRLIEIASYEVPVTRALEDADVKRSAVLRFR
ncbi:50S ribosomal protein L11 methyltransferase [Lichenihabitans sp. Uapishka_5]|uniref:class I SAM-dependent methyltransferase n=1 Tax=Lichenihabitans sp. Uapishka_5 TaxID=3037302 RepID=UPI0029E7CE5A|nr:50S ribosomal protein L11 methyltransferase [Lichenihabitans sp. Uapishka_5]MDX7950206.1 50S ribosomal protein L11 methyltransferase [Lichenihabitans sp. Uapishka_5]